jgi:hypothetical protein
MAGTLTAALAPGPEATTALSGVGVLPDAGPPDSGPADAGTD